MTAAPQAFIANVAFFAGIYLLSAIEAAGVADWRATVRGVTNPFAGGSSPCAGWMTPLRDISAVAKHARGWGMDVHVAVPPKE